MGWGCGGGGVWWGRDRGGGRYGGGRGRGFEKGGDCDIGIGLECVCVIISAQGMDDSYLLRHHHLNAMPEI